MRKSKTEFRVIINLENEELVKEIEDLMVKSLAFQNIKIQFYGKSEYCSNWATLGAVCTEKECERLNGFAWGVYTLRNQESEI